MLLQSIHSMKSYTEHMEPIGGHYNLQSLDPIEALLTFILHYKKDNVAYSN